MRLHTVLLLGFTLGVVGCAEKEQAAPEVQAEMEAAAPEAEAEMEAAAPDPEAEAETIDETAAVIEGWRDEALLDLMHVHAERLDEINYALDDGDLDGARMPAKWLAQNETVSGLPDALVPFVDGMRAAAAEVEVAEDVAAAQAAAQKIVVQCQACHAATGAAF